MGAHPLGPLHPLLARVARHARRLDRHNHLRTKGKYLPSFFLRKDYFICPSLRPPDITFNLLQNFPLLHTCSAFNSIYHRFLKLEMIGFMYSAPRPSQRSGGRRARSTRQT